MRDVFHREIELKGSGSRRNTHACSVVANYNAVPFVHRWGFSCALILYSTAFLVSTVSRLSPGGAALRGVQLLFFIFALLFRCDCEIEGRFFKYCGSRWSYSSPKTDEKRKETELNDYYWEVKALQ